MNAALKGKGKQWPGWKKFHMTQQPFSSWVIRSISGLNIATRYQPGLCAFLGLRFQSAGKQFYLHHGDGLGNGEKSYKLLRRIFRAPWSSWLFARLHPNFGFAIARAWSRKSRLGQGNKYEQFLGEEKEWLLGFCKEFLRNEGHIDYFVFGHRHLVIDMPVGEQSRYLNAGTWFNDSAYAVFDGRTTTIKRFENP